MILSITHTQRRKESFRLLNSEIGNDRIHGKIIVVVLKWVFVSLTRR